MSIYPTSDQSALRVSLAAMEIANQLEAQPESGVPGRRDLQPDALRQAFARLDTLPQGEDPAVIAPLRPHEASRLLVRVVDDYGVDMPKSSRQAVSAFARSQGVCSPPGRISPLQASLLRATVRREARGLKEASGALLGWFTAGLRAEAADSQYAASLLRKARRGVELSPEERSFLRAQRSDAVKTAVAAVLLALAPGGSLFVPLLARALPERVLPDGFRTDAPPSEG